MEEKISPTNSSVSRGESQSANAGTNDLPATAPSSSGESKSRPGPEPGTNESEEVPGGTLHALFETQAKKRPKAIAVTLDDQRWTYQLLNERANQLAHHLMKLGVGPDVLVGICLERSLELIIAILGILKAGGAYVPLDLAYPKERVAFMLGDADVKLVLTQQNLLENLPDAPAPAATPTAAGRKTPGEPPAMLCLDKDRANIRQESTANPDGGVRSDHLAYVIYTSGSTGTPKGVLVTHRNVVRLFAATDAWFHFGPEDVWTLFHSYAFDFSVWEIWGALIYGGRLVVVPYLVSRSPAAFYALLAREKVTVLNQTPSAFRQLIWAEPAGETRQDLSLRHVIFGGEALELQSLKPWFERHGDQQPALINMYGITETTVHVTYRPLTRQDVNDRKVSVIGVPIPDLEIHILDDELKPVATGVAGELYVGGAGLARGYLNRPQLTAERFIPNPFSKIPGARLYRTGDLARLLPDGDIEYLGRCDQQVKVRGFRIELGEIESVLNRHAAVRESVVIAAEAGDGDNRLVAYAILHPGTTPSTTDLRDFLKVHLPDYMVPSVFMFLTALPLTPNGKVDRAALPHPDRVRPKLKDEFVAPQTAEEKLLAAIWAEVLEVHPVGIHDNFFELGGDSIRSIQVLARAHQQGLQLSLAQLFQEQTIHNLLRRPAIIPPAADKPEPVLPFSLISPADRQKLPQGLEDAYPALLLQRGMFFHNDLNPASAIFHDVFSFRIQFLFVQPKLEQAVAQFIARHPCMRTAFDLDHFSEPLQLVQPTARVPFTVEDLRHLNPGAQEQALDGWIAVEKRRPFDRGAAPLLRVHVQLYRDEVFQLIVSFHHAILDGWSLAAMLTEFLQDYSALMKGSGEQIPPPKIGFADYVALERRTVASEECRRFWQEKLKDPSIQMLPRLPEALRAGGMEQVRGPEIQIPGPVFEGLKALAQSAGVPLKSVLQAAHFRVMSLLQGKPDVISGLVTNGRPEEMDGERVIGLFLNTVPVRMQLNGGTWLDLVRQMFQAERELLPFRRCPLAEIQRITGGQMLFETAFDFVHFHVYRNLQGYQDMGFMEGHYFEANSFALFTTFMLDVTTTRLQMHCDYDPAELCLEQIEAICGYYMNTLAAMAAQPAGPYHLFSPLSAPERQRLSVEWNPTPKDYPRDKTIPELFEAQVKRTPDAVAVMYGEQQLTYRELNQKANCLARHLKKLGVGPEVLVGICVERSLVMVVGLLGILKAGGAYVPMDPAYPGERPAFILKDTQTPVLLTQRSLMASLPSHQAQVLLLDRPIPDAPPEDIPRSAAADNLAYVIYTSGSTGQPKGVQIPHRAVVNFLTSMQQEPGLSASDILLAVTTVSFDIAGLELWLPLTVGARVVLAQTTAAADGKRLAAQLARCGATVMQATPATWRMLLEAGWAGAPNLKILCGGDAWPEELVRQLLSRCGSLWNMYGPTETTIWSAVAKVERAEVPLIGPPIANTQFYVLDPQLQPVPVGVPGELHIGGDGLARGYLNRPELTAEKFIADPFSKLPGRRLYKTGDLVRYQAKGRIEFLGRMDDQVKIRGYRIELGEVEAVLRRHPNVRELVVVARATAAGEKRLVAYLVPWQTPAPTTRELRTLVKAQLPDYMVPSAFIALEALPLTPNGKVDRKALPEPDSRPEITEFVPPGTPTEKALAEIWCKILGLKQVGIHDNFFELGGHSLTATQLISRLGQLSDVEVTLRDLFDTPTVAGLSKRLEKI
jgi:amino acid adenylation domain-containing protein